MFSRQIDLNHLQAKYANENKEKQFPPFGKRKERSRSSASSRLKKDSLKALKRQLAKHKEDVDKMGTVSAKGPLDSLLFEAKKTEATGKLSHSLEIDALFNKLVKSMLHMNKGGIQETTFFLDGSAFASSPLEGSRITITEYSTAPKVFNIQFTANQDALSFFQPHALELLNALQDGKRKFGVHRLDTNLLEPQKRPLVRSIERDKGEEKHE